MINSGDDTIVAPLFAFVWIFFLLLTKDSDHKTKRNTDDL